MAVSPDNSDSEATAACTQAKDLDPTSEIQKTVGDHPENRLFENELETTSIINDVLSAWPGIVIGGGVYCFVAGTAYFVTEIVYGSPGVGIEIVIGAMLALGGSFFLGMACALMVSLIAIPLTFAFDGSLKGVMDSRSTISICGGLTGHLATCHLWLIGIFGGAPIWIGLFSTFAIICGHIGAVYSASVDIRLAETWDHDSYRDRPRYQMKVWHMFVLTLWFAVIFAIEAFFANYYFIAAVGIWIVTQTIIIAIDRVWLRRWQKRQLKRELRSRN